MRPSGAGRADIPPDWEECHHGAALGRGEGRLGWVDIEAVIAALGSRFDAEETALIEQMLRDLHGTMPDSQLIKEIGLAIAVYRRRR